MTNECQPPSSDPRVRCAQRAGALLGEGPVWSAAEQALFWLDIQGCRIHRHDPASGTGESWPTPFRIGSLAPRASGGFIGGSEHGIVAIDRSFAEFSIVAAPEPDLPGNRFNDGKVDGQGRFWAGTMDDAEQAATGVLYRLDAELRVSCHDEGYRVTNGPTFSPDGAWMYHTDSAAQTVYRFAVGADGEPFGRNVFLKFEEGDGFPDGMTTDAVGNLWIAFWDGWCLRQVSPSGDILRKIDLPVQRPTSCTFGGRLLDTLFVTSASKGLDEAALARQPLAGSLFAIPGLGEGVPMPPFAG